MATAEQAYSKVSQILGLCWVGSFFFFKNRSVQGSLPHSMCDNSWNADIPLEVILQNRTKNHKKGGPIGFQPKISPVKACQASMSKSLHDVVGRGFYLNGSIVQGQVIQIVPKRWEQQSDWSDSVLLGDLCSLWSTLVVYAWHITTGSGMWCGLASGPPALEWWVET